MPFLRPVYRDGLIAAIHQRLAGQRSLVEAARVVEAPVFNNTHSGVSVPLVAFIPLVCSFGCHFQHEIRGLTLLGDEVSVAGVGGGGVDVQGDEQVGEQNVLVAFRRAQSCCRLAEDYGSVQAAQVICQSRGIGRETHIMVGANIQIRGPRVREPYNPCRVGRRDVDALGGHCGLRKGEKADAPLYSLLCKCSIVAAALWEASASRDATGWRRR